MECKICNREMPIKHFKKRVLAGTGQVLKVCEFCDNQDITNLASEVAKKIDVEIDCNSYLRVR